MSGVRHVYFLLLRIKYRLTLDSNDSTQTTVGLKSPTPKYSLPKSNNV